ncbi:MAG TPA: sodium:proton antiporter [Clostridia bacterium]|nr:sodium:proton antiporter [Clostridia bacterium]
MRKVLVYSLLLAAGLIGSQLLAGRGQTVIKLLTMFCLAFIATRIGYGFELTRDKPQKYAWDFVVATSTTIFPWLFCTVYFALAMAPAELWRSRDVWWEAILLGRFAAPTSVGLLFSMLAAAGLSATWLYKKARILAIFDDLDTILLFIPLKILLLSMNLQLVMLVSVILALLWAVWKYVHALPLPVSWPWVMLYSAVIVAVSEGISRGSKVIDDTASVEIEVLLLAFILGCMLARSPASADRRELGTETPREHRITTIVSACFMALAGLSMPLIEGPSEGAAAAMLGPKGEFPGWGTITIHVLIITALSNLGKMFPAFCYRREAGRRERLALAIGMFPRGEVGAGMLVLALSYGVAGPALTVAVLSLALNLVCSGLFVLIIKWLVAPNPRGAPVRA